MTNELNPGDIICFYEVTNPEGGLAGMIVKESRERNLDNYVQWAQQQQLILPPGHTFHRAMWVKVSESRLKEPFIPKHLPFKLSVDGAFLLNGNKFWLEHIFTIYDTDEHSSHEEE